MNDNEKMFYDLLAQILEKLTKIQNHLSTIEDEVGNIKRRM